MRQLRRKDRALTEDEALAILDKAEYGVLSTVSEGGKPYGVPLHFCVINGRIYFHCATEGHKIDNIERNRHVSFCVVGNVKVLPDKFTTNYESAIVFGDIEEVFDREKDLALQALVEKYSPDFVDEGARYIKKFKTQTRVFKITPSGLSGKARKA